MATGFKLSFIHSFAKYEGPVVLAVLSPTLAWTAAHQASLSCTISQSLLKLMSIDSVPARLLCPWNSPGKTIGVGSHPLPQQIFLTQGSSPGLLHCS